MQSGKKKINDYLYNYLTIKSQLQEKEERKKILLRDKKLEETVIFFQSLTNEEKKYFFKINCNNLFIQYFLNDIIIISLNKALANIYKDFKDSDLYPFSKDKFHFFLKDKDKLVCAITKEVSDELSDQESSFLADVINFNSFNNPNHYTINDLNLIEAIYCKYKDGNNNNLDEIITKEIKKEKVKQLGRVQIWKI